MRVLPIFLALLFTSFTVLGQSIFFTDASYSINFAIDIPFTQNISLLEEGLQVDSIGGDIISVPMEIPIKDASPFLTAALRYDSPSEVHFLNNFAIRFSKDSQIWGEWIAIQDDLHFPDESHRSSRIGQLIFAQATDKYFQIAIHPINQKILLTEIEVLFSSPGNSEKIVIRDEATNSRVVCPIPSFQGRDDWCTLGECPFANSPSMTNVTHLIVHHSAGSNTASDWAAVVRSIWHFHVDTRGWADIGYNWLIDPNGVLYEGRQDEVQGAHFSGHNSGTMGVCMLGNFHNASPMIAPQAAAIEKLEHLLCWKAEKKNINPLGTKFHASSNLNLKTIVGHRDGGATDCPGDSLYVLLPKIRNVVDSLLHPVGLSDPIINSGLVVVYPSLAQNSISIKFTKAVYPKLRVSIFSPFGKELKNIDLQGDVDIDITGFSKGIYYVRVLGVEVSDLFIFVKN